MSLVQILNEHNEPNTRATIKGVYEIIKIESQNRWPSLAFDIGSINNVLATKRLWAPRGFWKKIYELLIHEWSS